MDQPFFAAVDRNHRAAAPRIERQRHPGGRVHQGEQGGRVDIGRLHALDDRRSLQVGVDGLADERTRAVAADDEIGVNLRGGSGVEIPDGRNDAVMAFAEILERGAVQDRKPVDGSRVVEQHGFHVDLVDAVRRLGRRPIGVRPAGRGIAIAPAGNEDARELDARCRGAVRAVIGVVGRQSRCRAASAPARACGRSPSNATRHGCISRSAVPRRRAFPRRLPIFPAVRGPLPESVRPDRPPPPERECFTMSLAAMSLAG